MKQGAGAFRPCNGDWGERGATHVHLKSVKKLLLKSALRTAFDKTRSAAKKKRTAATKQTR